MKYAILCLGAISMLSACQMGGAQMGDTAKDRITAYYKGNLGDGHHCDETREFYQDLGAMTAPEQVRAYYDAKGYTMSASGTGATLMTFLSTGEVPGERPQEARMQCIAFRG